ncbi:MAG: response regulator [Clostridia bacterium]|nr:response regulator [Clostridia bacterium]
MKILAADDEKLALELLVDSIRKAMPDAEIFDFCKPSELLEFARDKVCDVAFLDIEMRGMTGVELAQKLKSFMPQLHIIFVTGYSSFMEEDLNEQGCGYIPKPANDESIRRAMADLDRIKAPQTPVMVRTFGEFAVLTDGTPIAFADETQKEILARIIDRKGKALTYEEICEKIFPGKKCDFFTKRKVRTYIAGLEDYLSSKGVKNLFVTKHEGVSANIDRQSYICDYYDFLSMKTWAINAYRGIYMKEYEWAKFDVEEPLKS